MEAGAVHTRPWWRRKHRGCSAGACVPVPRVLEACCRPPRCLSQYVLFLSLPRSEPPRTGISGFEMGPHALQPTPLAWFAAFVTSGNEASSDPRLRSEEDPICPIQRWRPNAASYPARRASPEVAGDHRIISSKNGNTRSKPKEPEPKAHHWATRDCEAAQTQSAGRTGRAEAGGRRKYPKGLGA